MGKQTVSVEQFLSALEHPLKAEIEAVRALVLGANPGITERIKWNAPSFCYEGDDRVTLRLHPPTKLQLVFHRGAKVQDSAGFVFEDASGLLNWLAADRAVVTLVSLDDIERHRGALTNLVDRWVQATSATQAQ